MSTVERAPMLARASLVAAVLGIATTAAVAVVRGAPVFGQDRHHVGVLAIDDLHEGQVELAAAILLALVAAMLAGRYRRRPTRQHLLLTTALAVLAADSLLTAVLSGSFDSLSVSPFATWSTAVLGLFGSGVLLAAALVVDRPIDAPRRAWSMAGVLSALGSSAALGACWLLRERMPAAFPARPEDPSELTLLMAHPLLAAVLALTGACWAAAGAIFTRRAARTDDELTGWVGLASVVAAVAFLNYTLIPSEFTEFHYLGELFFLAAVGILLVGALRQTSIAEAALVDKAVYDERRRIARELHDGVAQELSLISSTAHALSLRPQQSDHGLRRILEAAERAMDESRGAIRELAGAMRESLAHSIGEAGDVVAARRGVPLLLDLDEAIEVSPDVRLALVRVTREGVGHAVRRAGATSVSLELRRESVLMLRITAVGCVGARTQDQALTETSMAERVDQVGGSLTTADHGRPDVICWEVRWPATPSPGGAS